jgi:hypothetical protein
VADERSAILAMACGSCDDECFMSLVFYISPLPKAPFLLMVLRLSSRPLET